MLSSLKLASCDCGRISADTIGRYVPFMEGLLDLEDAAALQQPKAAAALRSPNWPPTRLRVDWPAGLDRVSCL